MRALFIKLCINGPWIHRQSFDFYRVFLGGADSTMLRLSFGLKAMVVKCNQVSSALTPPLRARALIASHRESEAGFSVAQLLGSAAVLSDIAAFSTLNRVKPKSPYPDPFPASRHF